MRPYVNKQIAVIVFLIVLLFVHLGRLCDCSDVTDCPLLRSLGCVPFTFHCDCHCPHTRPLVDTLQFFSLHLVCGRCGKNTPSKNNVQCGSMESVSEDFPV